MYSDYTVDDVLQTVSCLEQSLDKTWELVCSRGDTMEDLYFKQLREISKNEELQNAAQELIRNEFQKQEDIRLGLEKHKVHLQGLKDTVSNLKQLKFEKEMELLKLEKEVEKIRNKIQSASDDMEDVNKKKDVILTYKLLTNTSFVYTTRKVTGVVTKQSPKPFSFNPQDLSQEDITQKLWQLVLED